MSEDTIDRIASLAGAALEAAIVTLIAGGLGYFLYGDPFRTSVVFVFGFVITGSYRRLRIAHRIGISVEQAREFLLRGRAS